MMRIMPFLLFLLCLTGFETQAQKAIYSPYEKFDFTTGEFSVVGKVNDKLYVFRGSSQGYYLDAYDADMKRLATVVLDFFPAKINSPRFIAGTDKIIALYQGLEGNRIVQYAAKLDKDGRLIKRPVVIDDTKLGLFGGGKDRFSYAISDDKNKIVIYSTDMRGSSFKLNYFRLDEELKIAEKGTASFKADNDIATGDALLANDGTLYLPAYTPTGSKSYADQLWMLALAPGKNVFAAKELALENKFAAGTFMKMDATNNRIYAGGFYAAKKNSNYEGVTYTWYDINTGEFQKTKFIPFSDHLRSAADSRSKKHAFDDFKMRQIIVKNDGGFLLISEEHYITNRNSFQPGFGYYAFYYPPMSSNVREYHYNDILALSYTGDGTNEWHSFIRKEQYSLEDGGAFSSYGLANGGGSLGFLYNNFSGRRSKVQFAELEAGGRTDIRSIDAGEEDPDWLPRSAKQISSHEIVVPCLRQREICFAKIVF